MAITLTYLATVIALPDDLEWTDENSWSPVVQTSTYTLTGALLVESSARQAGQPVTLQGTEECAWLARLSLLALTAWAAVPGRVMTLQLRGVDHSVMFDHERGAIEATPVAHYSLDTITDSDFYAALALRFIKV
jgi:hypothetical protein